MALIEHTKTSDRKHGTELRCGDCIHYKTGPSHPAYPGLCRDNGKKVYSPICAYFSPDVTALKSVSEAALVQLSSLVNNCNSQQCRILSHVLMRRAWFDNAGLTFGQKLYFVLGDNYLSNIVHGHLVSVTKDGEQVVVVSTLEGLQRSQATARLYRNSVLTEAEYSKLRTALIKADRVFDPGSRNIPSVLEQLRMTKKELAKYHKSLEKSPDSYQPPTIDTVPTKWLDRRVLTKLIDPKNQKADKATKRKPVKGARKIRVHVG